MIETEILIVGCGPVGAVMANLLGARGIRTFVLEREPAVHQLPRAIGMDDEVLRVLQSQGLDAAYEENVFTLRGMDLLRGNRRRMRRIKLDKKSQTLGHPLLTLFHQPSLEENIRKGLPRYADTVDVRLGEEVRSIRDLEDGAEATFVNVESGREETVHARYVLGCDGGRSPVRRTFDVEQEDLGLHQPWVVVDAIMKRPIEVSGYAEQICDPARPGTFVPAPAPRNRWEFMVMPGDDQEQLVTPAALKELIRPWASPEDYEVERAVIYTFHALIAKRWRLGRSGSVFLLGNAAHQMPPFLGQGMCAGIRDAFNLAWKLDLVLSGRAGADLLDTYQSERMEHVRKMIKLAVKIGDLIQSPSRLKSFLVNASMIVSDRLRINMLPKSMKDIPLGPGCVSQAHAPIAKSRCPFPQPLVRGSDGTDRLFDEFLGPHFTLLSRAGASVDGGETEKDSFIYELEFRLPGAAMPADGIPSVIDNEGVLGRWLADRNCDAVLLRPDRQPFGIYRGEDANYDSIRRDLRRPLGQSEAGWDVAREKVGTMEVITP